MKLTPLFSGAVVVAAISTMAGIGGASAAVVYADSTTTSYIQDWGHNLGLDFQVNNTITVSALGAFDNGLTGNLTGADNNSGVTVGIFNLANGLEVGGSVHFLPETGTQIGADAFLPANIVLAPGQYSIVAFNDVNYNQGFWPGPINTTQTLDDLGGALSFIGGGRYDYGSSFALPGIVDGGPANRYDAGTFAATASTAVPEPITLSLFGAGFAGAAVLRRRKKKIA